ncbi:MAG: hypothetical protein WD491_04250 [Balneolales bacterium]
MCKSSHYMKYLNAHITVVALFTCLFIAIVPEGHAQVQIAPKALYMDDVNRTGRMVLRNSSDGPVEVSIDLIFGYPDSDDNGRVFMNFPDPVPDDEPSAAEWVRVYPRNLALPPGERQTIRFAARPPGSLPDGEYWARPAITTRPVRQDTESQAKRVSARINIAKRMVLALNYRHRDVNTGIDIEHASAEVTETGIHIEATANRTGNAAFLGNVTLKVRTKNGRLIKEIQRKTAVYHSRTRLFNLGLDDFSSGNYFAEIGYNTEREGEKPGDIIQAEAVSETVRFTVP